MSPDGAYRIEDLLALLPEPELNALAERLGCRDTISEVRDFLTGSDGDLSARISGLDDDTAALLHSMVNAVPPLAPMEITPQLQTLIDGGLVFMLEMQDEPRLYVPLEVQLLFRDAPGLSDPDLRLLLLARPQDDVMRLEGLYNHEDGSEDPPADDWERILRLAAAMESRSTLREIYQSLPATAQEVLGWTCEHSGPLSAEEVEDLATDAAEYHGERAGIAVDQLLRFGLLMSYSPEDTGDVLVVPRSLRPSVLSVVDATIARTARAQYEALLRSGHLGFPDEGPRGWGGNALKAMRQLAVNWVSGELEELPPEYGVAVGMQLLNPEERQTGAFASLLLDLSGETAFARQALRLWLALVDDPWTLDLIEATGGDPEMISEYFAGTKGHNDTDTEIWFGYMFLLRAQFLFILSLMPPGKWFSIAELSTLFHLLVARSTVANLTHESLSGRFPYEALPDYGIVILREERRSKIGRWIEDWLTEFVSVIGAAQIDSSGKHFRVHPDAFCVFRDSDLWFGTAWNDLAAVVGEDLDIWMPIPNDPGPRVSGTADIWVTGTTSIAIAPAVHLFDLLRLAKWAEPVAEPAGFGFRFTKSSVAKALDAGTDGEEMLVWLSVRLHGEVNPAIRALFPQSSSAADGASELWRSAAQDRVEELLTSLDSWGASPPAGLLEEIRGWGTAAIPPISERLKSLIEEGSLEDPRVQHTCILLGELGAQSAVPLVTSVLADAPNELVGHAAAAASMRLGRPCLPYLIPVLRNGSAPKLLRLLSAMALTGLATLHPETQKEVGEALLKAVEDSHFDPDFQTRLILELCRVGHPQAESLIEQLQSDDNWASNEWRPEDALWLARISPCVWGSLLYSTPLAMLYLVADEADELEREAGIGEILLKAGMSSESVLYGRPRPKREKPEEDL